MSLPVPATHMKLAVLNVTNTSHAPMLRDVLIHDWSARATDVCFEPVVQLKADDESATTNLCHLSFYTCLGNPFPCHDWGFIPDKQKGWLTTGFTNDTALIRAGSADKIKSMFYIGDIFFEFGKGLRPDHMQRWQKQAAEVESLVAAGQIVGFFVGDELVSGKRISWEDVATAVRTLAPLKKKYKNLFVWQNEGGTGWEAKLPAGLLPAEIDVISVDDYAKSTKELRQWYENTLYKVLNASTQRVFAVPGSFGSRVDPKKTLAQFTTDMIAKAHAMYQWALQDPMVYGIVPWHWEARKVGQTSAYKEVGTSEMPALIAAWADIGRAIGKRRSAGYCNSFPPSVDARGPAVTMKADDKESMANLHISSKGKAGLVSMKTADTGQQLVPAGQLGVDTSTWSHPWPQRGFECLRRNASFLLVEGYRIKADRVAGQRAAPAGGHVVATAPATIRNARAGGFTDIDLYHFPDTSLPPASQINATVRYFVAQNVTFGKLWLDIEGPKYWKKNCTQNVDFLRSLVVSARAALGPTRVGIYASQSQWTPIMCGDSSFTDVPLWYAHWDEKADFNDFHDKGIGPFGGWNAPVMKQYKGSTRICNINVDLDYRPPAGSA
jgi:hypothetical protein